MMILASALLAGSLIATVPKPAVAVAGGGFGGGGHMGGGFGGGHMGASVRSLGWICGDHIGGLGGGHIAASRPVTWPTWATITLALAGVISSAGYYTTASMPV